MEKSSVLGFLFLIVLAISLILYLKDYACENEKKLYTSLNRHNVRCIRSSYRFKDYSRSRERFIIRHFENFDDTCFSFNLCSEFLNSSHIPKKLENTTFFVIYDKENDKSVLPVWTKKSYEVLRKYFSDSAKLVDTSLFE